MTRLLNLSLEQDHLQHAIKQGQFRLVYQPKLSLNTGHVVGVEALIRWNHPEYGWISPAEFIPLAEQNGTITEITKWVLYEACRQNKAWHDQGFPKTVMSVNISPLDFESTELYQLILDTLNQTGLDPSLLEIEITENVMLNHIDQTIETLKEIKRTGIRIAVDDFGKGNSTIRYIRDLPITTVKIDRSFMQDIPYNQKESTVVKNMIELSHNLDLEVVAEGVETEEVVTFLSLHSCDVAQGFLFSKPMLFDDYQALIKQTESYSKELIYRLEKHINIKSAQMNDHRFKSLFEQNPDLVCSFSLEGYVISVNPTIQHMLGLKQEDVVDSHLADFICDSDQFKALRHFREVLNGETPEAVELELIHSDGHYVPTNAVCFPMLLGERIVGIYSVIKDMSRQKELEQKLIESEKKYRLITENMSDLVVVVNRGGSIDYASPSNEDAFQVKQEVILQQNIMSFIDPKDVGHAFGVFDRIFDKHEAQSTELRLNTKSGKVVWIEAHGNPVISEDGTVEQIVVVSRDITKKKQMEAELKAAQDDLKNTLERQLGMTFKYIKTQSGYVHTLCEGELMRKFGYESEEVVGYTLYDFLPFEKAQMINYYYELAWLGEDVHFESELNGISFIMQLKPVMYNDKVLEVIGSCAELTRQ